MATTMATSNNKLKQIILLVLVVGAATITTSLAYAQQSHSIAANTYSINAAESISIPFTIPDGVTNAYVSGSVLITGGLLSGIDFSILNRETGTEIMRHSYLDQGNIEMYLPAGSYDIILHNGSFLAGEIHTVTLTLNAIY
jgi:hypothetical protein